VTADGDAVRRRWSVLFSRVPATGALFAAYVLDRRLLSVRSTSACRLLPVDYRHAVTGTLPHERCSPRAGQHRRSRSGGALNLRSSPNDRHSPEPPTLMHACQPQRRDRADEVLSAPSSSARGCRAVGALAEESVLISSRDSRAHSYRRAPRIGRVRLSALRRIAAYRVGRPSQHQRRGRRQPSSLLFSHRSSFLVRAEPALAACRALPR